MATNAKDTRFMTLCRSSVAYSKHLNDSVNTKVYSVGDS
jgi:hypothetical protein